jgi:hypothetical protein
MIFRDVRLRVPTSINDFEKQAFFWRPLDNYRGGHPMCPSLLIRESVSSNHFSSSVATPQCPQVQRLQTRATGEEVEDIESAT